MVAIAVMELSILDTAVHTVAVVAVTSSYLAPVVVDVDVEHEASRIVELHLELGLETTPVIRTRLGPDHL